jgi:FAD/FMN-containing dehydrogenase
MLDKLLPGQVDFPSSLKYKAQQSDYYTGEQISLLPSCRVTPSDAEDISSIVKLASQNECLFAVKSGGHMGWRGASNVGPSGFTIDLDNMKGISVSEDKKTVSFASGSKWTEVYKALTPFNLTTVGGRSAGVGVGGFLNHVCIFLSPASW